MEEEQETAAAPRPETAPLITAVQRRGGRPRERSAGQMRRFCIDWHAGFSGPALAEKHKISLANVYQIAHRLKLPARPRHDIDRERVRALWLIPVRVAEIARLVGSTPKQIRNLAAAMKLGPQGFAPGRPARPLDARPVDLICLPDLSHDSADHTDFEAAGFLDSHYEDEG